MFKNLYLLILPLILNAQVFIDAPKTFFINEPVVFSISAVGSDIKFPQIKEIAGFSVQQRGTTNQTNILNGAITQQIIAQYQFFPTSTVTIPSFDIEVAGQIEQTQPVVVTSQQVLKTKSNIFDLEIDVNKDNIYVGEEIVLTMTFKYKKDAQLYDLKFSQPNFNNFWSKRLESSGQEQDDLYIIQKVRFLLFPQKSGDIEISPLRIDVTVPDNTQSNSYFRRASKVQRIYSNNIKLEVKPLPKDIHLIGDFSIKTTINQNSIKQGEAISLQLEVTGRGNIDDLEEYDLTIPNATIYDNPSTKDFNIKNNQYGGIYKKSYSIVAQDDFIIPAMVLKYFDKKTQKVKIVQSESYNIKVIGAVKSKRQLEVKEDISQPIVTKKVVEVIKTSDNDKILFFVFGFIFAIILLALYFVFKNKKTNPEDTTLLKSIKISKNTNELLKKLSPYINIDKKLDKIIYQLDENKDINLKKIKQQLSSTIKELKL